MGMLYAVLGVLGIWGFHWILEPITTPKPPEVSTNLTRTQLFIQRLFAERAMMKNKTKRRMCKIGWEYNRKYCMRLIPYTFKWNAAKKFCTSIKAQLTMAFTRDIDKDYILDSMKRFNMFKTYVAVGYYAHVEPPDPLDYQGEPTLTVRNLAGKDVSERVKIVNNVRFEGPTIHNKRCAFLYRGKLFWMPSGQFAFPYCEYKRKPEEEPDRWEGFPDEDMPPRKQKPKYKR